ncbi:MAG TPA: NUDIX hydrolase [Candidatus Krumholzibacteria bacterium]|nr:NUDIX hydrolase [Candidatus Krumholzibacteria bacterium]
MSSIRPEQAATIPFRHSKGTVKVCLIRRRGSDTWSLPKGSVDPGDTLGKTALKESWEEAGLLGRLCGDPIGTYRYEKLGNTLSVSVYLMEVIAHEDDWDEADLRERKWFTLREATELLSNHPVQKLLPRAGAMLGGPPDSWRQP